jgi:hypothetical protein
MGRFESVKDFEKVWKCDGFEGAERIENVKVGRGWKGLMTISRF